MSRSEATRISLALPSLEAAALAHFVKRVDFEMVARLSSVAVVADGKSEADLIWQALAGLRSALAEARAAPQAPPPGFPSLRVIPGPWPDRRRSDKR